MRHRKIHQKDKLPKKLTKTFLDAIWSADVKKRDGYECKLCGKREGLNSHHVMRKQSHLLRYSLDNGITLCRGCHKFGAHSEDIVIAKGHLNVIESMLKEDGRWARLMELRGNRTKLSLQQAYDQLRGNSEAQ